MRNPNHEAHAGSERPNKRKRNVYESADMPVDEDEGEAEEMHADYSARISNRFYAQAYAQDRDHGCIDTERLIALLLATA